MNTVILASRILLLPFVAFSLYAVWQMGIVGFFDYLFSNPAGWQVWVDLVIALSIILTFIYQDAAKQGRRFYPWLLLTLMTGSISPMLYFATRKKD